MPDHRIGGAHRALPEPDGTDWHAQRQLLLELVVTPPPWGDDVDYLRRRLPIAPDSLEPAIDALVIAGLAHRSGGLVWATPPALYFEHLWPVRP